MGFDASSLATGKGLARFQSEFLRVAAGLEIARDLTVFAPAHVPLPAAPWWRVDIPSGSMLAWEQFGLPRAARRERLDVVITTSERAALWGPRQVVYIYEHPRYRAARSRETGVSLRQRLVDRLTLMLFPLAMHRAAAVLAASHSTASDLAYLTPATVVHSAASSEFSPGGSVAGYFLHVASDDPRDNSDVVLRAFATLANKRDRPELVIAGTLHRRLGPLHTLAKQLGVEEHVRWTGFVETPELVELYRGAIAYLDPSLYEGFGLQALEALACGTPAITSDRMSLPEVVGDGGILLDPNDVAGFADAMSALLHDPDLRPALRARALAQASRFSWEQTVRAVLGAAEALASAR